MPRVLSSLRAIPARVLCAVLLACAGTAHATSYQDMWWNPSESGWGMNINQQGDTLFVAWFVQATDGSPTWFSSAARKTGNDIFTGPVTITRGSYFAGAWNPASVANTTAGTATFNFTDKKTLSLTYTANSATVNKTLTRFTFAAQRIAGDFYGAELGQPSNCTDNTRYFANSLFRVTTTATTMSIVQETQGAAGTSSCTLTGAYSQVGSNVEASGNYSCTSGVTGTWRGSDGLFSDDAFSMKIAAQNGACRVDATYSGSRN